MQEKNLIYDHMTDNIQYINKISMEGWVNWRGKYSLHIYTFFLSKVCFKLEKVRQIR